MGHLNSPLHRLGLAVSSEMVWQAALVAVSTATCSTSNATPGASVSAAGRASCSMTHPGGWAVASKMAREIAGIATSACSSTTQAERRAVSLYVAKSLAVIALLGCCSSVHAREGRVVSLTRIFKGRGATYFRWFGDGGIHWTHDRAACLFLVSIHVVSGAHGPTDSCSKASQTRSRPRHSDPCCRT
ncbi:hypothetical protein BDU57DRAFT_288272 [Ampelomyces quisqualis]|uniref:Uncharacterized protein n=1 Tax=Ampelomyces quisqualis TaxID=50730 RepID=A0A6A5QHF2_AMPQU|nr:hypothetical protein BDU57DRAFT_288272 [Ampelomyces quisqualis]